MVRRWTGLGTIAGGVLAVGLWWPGRVAAEETPAGGNGTAGAVPAVMTAWSVSAISDYRFRGVSFSGGAPVAQADFTLTHGSGIYGTVFASSLGRARGVGGAEVDLITGWRRQFRSVSWSAGVEGFLYPGAFAVSSYAVQLTATQPVASRLLGPVTVMGNVEYSPRQGALRTAQGRLSTDTYVSVTATAVRFGKRLEMSGTAGYGQGAFDYHGGRGKVDGLLSAMYWLGRVGLNFSLVTTSVRAFDGAGRNLAGTSAVTGVRLR